MRRMAYILAGLALLLGTRMASAQGSFYQGMALSVTSMPGMPQGLTNVVVPIPNAAVYVCAGTYNGTACSATTGTLASLWSCQGLSGCPLTQPLAADLYGNFGFWAAAGSFYYTQTGQVNGALTSASYQITLPLACTATCQAQVFNATAGYEFNGAAPVNHVLLGNGTNYVDSPSIPASIITGLPGAFYQTMQSQGTAMPQENALNFGPLFALADSSTNRQTNVALNQTGNGTYVPSVLASALPGTSKALAQWDGNGNLGVSTSTVVDEYWTFTGCAVLNVYNSAAGCQATANLPSAMADTNYRVNCSASGDYSGSGGATWTAGTSISPTPLTTTTISYVEMQVYSGGNPPTYVPTVSCHAHHN